MHVKVVEFCSLVWSSLERAHSLFYLLPIILWISGYMLFPVTHSFLGTDTSPCSLRNAQHGRDAAANTTLTTALDNTS